MPLSHDERKDIRAKRSKSDFGTHSRNETLGVVRRYMGLHDEPIMFRHDLKQRFARFNDATDGEELAPSLTPGRQ
jgi:hypothetical protein